MPDQSEHRPKICAVRKTNIHLQLKLKHIRQLKKILTGKKGKLRERNARSSALSLSKVKEVYRHIEITSKIAKNLKGLRK